MSPYLKPELTAALVRSSALGQYETTDRSQPVEGCAAHVLGVKDDKAYIGVRKLDTGNSVEKLSIKAMKR